MPSITEQILLLKRDAEYARKYCHNIALANPTVILTLIAAYEAQAKRIAKLEAALEESIALNENFVSVAEDETLSHLSEYKEVIALSRAVLRKG